MLNHAQSINLGEHPKCLAIIGWYIEGYEFRHTKALISVKRSKTEPKLLPKLLSLLSRTNTKSYAALSMVPSSATSDDFEGLLCTLFA